MTVVTRNIRATPYRAANDAWEVIVRLLAPNPGPAHDELERVSGIASSLIASESSKDHPMVVWGAGPRVRIRCQFGEDAVTGDNATEDKLAKSPTDGDWSMSLPCSEEDLTWIKAALAKQSNRITARKLGEAVEIDEREERSASSVTIDKEAFFRP